MKRIIVNIMNAIRMKLGLRPIVVMTASEKIYVCDIVNHPGVGRWGPDIEPDEKIRSMENGGFVWIEEGETS